jgi:plasmid stability protein
MSNITISLDDQLIKQARIRVAQQGTSLSAKVRELLQHYVNGTDDATQRLREEATAHLMLAIESATLATATPQRAQGVERAKAAQRADGPGRKPSLRETLYAGDFRANDRKPPQLSGKPSAKPGIAPSGRPRSKPAQQAKA